MPRPKRHKINSTPESFSSLLQEIYNECVDQRNIALIQRNKLLSKLEDLDDVSMVGKITVDLLKIVDLAIDKKLALAKLQSGLIGTKGQNDTPEEGLSTEQRKFLQDTIKQINDKGDVDPELDK